MVQSKENMRHPIAHPRRYPLSALEVAILWPLYLLSIPCIRASIAVWLSLSDSEEVPKNCLHWKGRQEGWWDKGQAGDRTLSHGCPNKCVVGGHWRFKLCRGKKKILTGAKTQTTAQTLIWKAHISTITQIYKHEPEQLYPQGVGGKMNACWRQDWSSH